MFENLRGDIDRWRQEDVEQGWWKRYEWICTIRYLLYPQMLPVIVYRYEHWVYKRVHVPVVRQLLRMFGSILRRFAGIWTGVLITPRAEIGPGFEVHTHFGVLVGITKIGKNCTVGSGVLITCGVRSIGDNVYIGAGAKLVGDVKIGNNVVIMPNSLVITDVADNTTIVGVPARIKLRGGRPREFFSALGKPKAPPKQVGANGSKPSDLAATGPKSG